KGKQQVDKAPHQGAAVHADCFSGHLCASPYSGFMYTLCCGKPRDTSVVSLPQYDIPFNCPVILNAVKNLSVRLNSRL
ncbi:MAG: hypothetical protein IIV99_03880, partial [Oscillospiraceae bacterium]|nr:hypothetical protein [Oscillospiraceae bacterium]